MRRGTRLRPQQWPVNDLASGLVHLAVKRLGFAPLSFFVKSATEQSMPGLEIYSRADNKGAASAYQTVFTQTRPMIEQWLGTHPKRPVVLVDLPDANDLPFEERNILFLPLQTNATDDTVGPVLAHMLGHSYFISPRVWLNEGVAQFMTLLWIEQRAGVRRPLDRWILIAPRSQLLRQAIRG